MGREANVPLLFTLSQLSYWSAKHLGDAGLKQMQVRGRLQEGMVADIVIFNPQTVAPTSTYTKGDQGLPPVGIPHVIVNGGFRKTRQQGDRPVSWSTDPIPGRGKGSFCSGESKTVE